MEREMVDGICAAFPGAEVSQPFGGGHDVWKVGGKIFAAVNAMDIGVSVKTDSVETATMLIEAGAAKKAPYFHRSWVLVPLDQDDGELRHRIETSYSIIKSGLSKKVQAGLV